jgi:glycosyltransferase involved in cell wall biosynthesis
LSQKRPDTYLAIAGEGTLKNLIVSKIQEFNLKNRVILLGRSDNVPELMASADVFVLSSLWEGLPGVVMEAMASELPVVATEAGGTPELIIDGVTGRVVPIGAPSEFAEVVNEVLSMTKESRREMGKAGRKRVVELFHVDEMVKNYVDLYHECLNKIGRSHKQDLI